MKPATAAIRLALLLISVPAATAGRLAAQEIPPPDLGGRIVSLGLPHRHRVDVGVLGGITKAAGYRQSVQYGYVGIARDLMPALPGVLHGRTEGYVGLRDADLDGGIRAAIASPALRLSAGYDVNIRDGDVRFVLGITTPVRRGGILGRGSMLRVDWFPRTDETYIGLSVPMWSRAGRTRPRDDATHLGPLLAGRPPSPGNLVPEAVAALQRAGEHAVWIGREIAPLIEMEGHDPAQAVAESFGALEERLASVPSPDHDFQRFHREIEAAFRAAVGDSTRAAATAARARGIMLDAVIIPWNRLLGQRRRDRTSLGLILVARSTFLEYLHLESGLDEGRRAAAASVFAGYGDLVERVREDQRSRWDDDRLVWLPVQLAVPPSEYRTPEQIDRLVARATGTEWTEGNHIWYLLNELFHVELARSVREAELYHVLWIHDFRGTNRHGEPDQVGFTQTVNYLRSLAHRVRDYDRRGTLPAYFILLDQYYANRNASALWLELLQSPLGPLPMLPRSHRWMLDELRAAQQELREAVAGSTLLQERRSLFGDRWLDELVKVHVSVTNPHDPAFWSKEILPLVGISDDVIRDHRKIVFSDLDARDPDRGMVMLTGMGVGESYVGGEWEDRALILTGPAAFAMKEAAVDLLVSNGIGERWIPHVLRADTLPVLPQSVDSTSARAMVLHNMTGYGDKPINVAKAMLYTLMPPGSVVSAPDALWQNPLFAGMLVGAATRGARVMMIAPSLNAAPSGGWPQMARAHSLLSRVIAARKFAGRALAASGGMVEVGLYDVATSVDDVPGRARMALHRLDQGPDWLRTLLPIDLDVSEALGFLQALVDSIAPAIEDGEGKRVSPKLHLKGHFMATEAGWSLLFGSDRLPRLIALHQQERLRQLTANGGEIDVRQLPAVVAAETGAMLDQALGGMGPAGRQQVGYWLLSGSANMDYRSMFLDGEVMAFVSGRAALQGFVDYLTLTLLTTWVESQEELDRLLPPPSTLQRRVSNWLRTVL